jgi:hypothetical protein
MCVARSFTQPTCAPRFQQGLPVEGGIVSSRYTQEPSRAATTRLQDMSRLWRSRISRHKSVCSTVRHPHPNGLPCVAPAVTDNPGILSSNGVGITITATRRDPMCADSHMKQREKEKTQVAQKSIDCTRMPAYCRPVTLVCGIARGVVDGLARSVDSRFVTCCAMENECCAAHNVVRQHRPSGFSRHSGEVPSMMWVGGGVGDWNEALRVRSRDLP